MNAPPALGFVGFGEAACHIAKGLRQAGIRTISACDIHTATPGRGELIRRRAEESGTQLAPSNAAVAGLSAIASLLRSRRRATTSLRLTATISEMEEHGGV